MEATYSIIGGDGKEYGPVSLTGMQAWIDEGRITREMQVRRGDQSDWRVAEGYDEFRWSPAVAVVSPAGPPALPSVPQQVSAPAAASSQISPQQATLIRLAIKRCGNWFFWIAGLSALNTLLAFLHVDIAFIVGLGITQIFDALASRHGGAWLALILDAMVLGIFALFGVVAGKGNSWAFIVGMVLYTLDAGLCVMVQLWLNVAFHLYVLFHLFQGVRVNQMRKKAGA